MYVYIWRVTIFFYIYRIKTLLPLSFWRSEKIFDGITAVSTDREDIIFSFMFFLFTPEDLFQIVMVSPMILYHSLSPIPNTLIVVYVYVSRINVHVGGKSIYFLVSEEYHGGSIYSSVSQYRNLTRYRSNIP
jgi:hypothetical protein